MRIIILVTERKIISKNVVYMVNVDIYFSNGIVSNVEI